ncbi:hypothetical protein QUF96_02150 [Bacillus bombysepticus]|nr:hypothetical protein [Bacillus bombysepticus]
MNVKKELKKTLQELDVRLQNYWSREERAMLYIAKSNTLMALQKYETSEEKAE